MAELVPVRVGGRVVAYRPAETVNVDYSTWLKADLEAEVEARRLGVTGTKAELASALEADDDRA
jgi:hypothetical protein